MKSATTLFLTGLVLLVCGQFFGWWSVSIPGMEAVPSYHERRTAREAERSARRQANGLEDENGNSLSSEEERRQAEVRRRSNALRNGGGVGDY